MNVIKSYGALAAAVLLGAYLVYLNTVEKWGWPFSVLVFLILGGFVVAYLSGRTQGREEGARGAHLDARKRAGAIADPEEIKDFLAAEAQKELQAEADELRRLE